MKKSRRLIAFYTPWIPAVCLAMLPPQSEAADAKTGTLAIRTVDVNAGVGEPPGVRATLVARSLKQAETQFATVDQSGTYKTAPFECAEGMNFKAVPKSKMMYVSSDDWKPCGYSEIVSSFSRNAYATNIKTILDLDYSVFAETNPFIAKLGSKLVTAANSDSFGDVPVLSTELMRQFDLAGRKDLANAARVVVYESTSVVLGVEKPLYFDEMQKEYVMPQETIEAIETLQAVKGFETSGKIDWQTMDVLSAKYGTAITEHWGAFFKE